MYESAQPATPNELREALRKVITAQVTKETLMDGVLKKVRGDLEQLAEHWRSLVRSDMLASCDAAAAALLPEVDAAVDEAYGSLEGVNHGITADELVSEDFKAGHPRFDELLTGYVKYTAFRDTARARAQGLQAEVEQHIAKARNLATVEDGQYRELEKLRGLLEDRVMQAEARLAAVEKDALAAVLDPVIEHVRGVIRAGQDALVHCTEDALRQEVATLSGPLDSLGSEAITWAVWPYLRCCDDAVVALANAMDVVAEGVLAGLNGMLTTNAMRGWLRDLLTDYGAPAFVALGKLDPALQRMCLERWTALRPAVRKALPEQPSAALLGEYLQVVAASPNSVAATEAVNQKATERISVPNGITGFEWKRINGIAFPGAFTTPKFSTDTNCMHHCAIEVGANPTKDKLERYFTELVRACADAVAVWQANGRPPEWKHTGTLDVGTWRILVKNKDGRAEVFHIDSQYQKSAWRMAG